jgi:Coenzyme PQQ synthesis protein D (PqqD)
MTLTAESVVAQDTEPVVARVDGDVVMLSEREGAYFGLNGVGSKIWELIAQPRTVGDICQSLSAVYEVDDATLMREVTDFLRLLLARKLVRVIEEAGGDKSEA